MTDDADAAVFLGHRQILTVLGALMLGMLLAALDQTIVSTALPTIVGDLGGLNHLSWVVTSYLLASTISTPLYGKLGDLYGRKSLFQFAIVIFLVGSMLSGISQNMVELIGFRALQGLGAGGLMVGAQAIIGDVVPPRERGKYQGMMGGIFALASIAGPLLGGFLTDNVSWRWIFYINVPLGAVALVVTATALPSTARRLSHRIDWLGAGLLAAGTSAFILLATWGGTQYGWVSAPIIALAIGGAAVLVAFFVVERHVAEPIIPPRLFRNSVFNVASAVGFVIGFAMFGAIVFLPLFLQLVGGASATSSGLNLLPLMVGLLTASIGSGQIISRMGRYKIFPIVGTALAAIAMLLLSTLNPQTPRLLLSLYMVVLGAGLGMVMQVLVLAVQNAAERRDLGVATSSATFLRSIGSSFGVAIFGAIFSSQLAANLRLRLPASALGGNLNPTSLQGNPAALQKLPPAIHSGLVTAVSDSLHVVFLTAVPILIVAFVITLFLREIPLGARAKAPLAAAEGMGMDEAAEVVLATADQHDGRVTSLAEPRSALRRVPEPTVDGIRQSNDKRVGR
jgi:EmrB/QacA subfamily drug resistance transporter